MVKHWRIFCEESGDKGIPRSEGSSYFYIITAILVPKKHEQDLIDVIDEYKFKELRLKGPLEWKRLRSNMKRNDKKISRFLRKIDQNGPDFLISNVICNKDETTGPGFVDRNKFMNYLYGLMFKRIGAFLKETDSKADLIIDRNTDKIAQDSLRKYISKVTRYSTGSYPRHSKPKWINPEDHSILGMSDFISGLNLRVFTNYIDTDESCKKCCIHDCMLQCSQSGFRYQRSFKYVKKWNYNSLENWEWSGLLYHPYENKNNYVHLMQPK